MKGMMTKDFLLLLQRKRFFAIIGIVAVLMFITTKDITFLIGWLAIVTSLFSLSSLSYDEYDNCYPFLMSMPVTGKIYAIEKYVFGFVCGTVSLIAGLIISIILTLVTKGELNIIALLSEAVGYIPLYMILLDISLPINMKFGNEKGRIVLFVVWGAVAVLIMVVTKMPFLKDFANLFAGFANLIFPLLCIGSAVLTVISIITAIKIMEKKEY